MPTACASGFGGDEETICPDPAQELFGAGGADRDWANTTSSPEKLLCRIAEGCRFNTENASVIVIVSHGNFIREVAKLLQLDDSAERTVLQRQLGLAASNNLFTLSIRSQGVVYVLMRHCRKQGQLTHISPIDPPCVQAAEGRICGVSEAVSQLTWLMRQWGIRPADQVGLYSSCTRRAKTTAAALWEAIPAWWVNGVNANGTIPMLPYVSEVRARSFCD